MKIRVWCKKLVWSQSFWFWLNLSTHEKVEVTLLQNLQRNHQSLTKKLWGVGGQGFKMGKRYKSLILQEIENMRVFAKVGKQGQSKPMLFLSKLTKEFECESFKLVKLVCILIINLKLFVFFIIFICTTIIIIFKPYALNLNFSISYWNLHYLKPWPWYYLIL